MFVCHIIIYHHIKIRLKCTFRPLSFKILQFWPLNFTKRSKAAEKTSHVPKQRENFFIFFLIGDQNCNILKLKGRKMQFSQHKKVHPQREPKSPKRIKPTPTTNTTKPTQQHKRKVFSLPSNDQNQKPTVRWTKHTHPKNKTLKLEKHTKSPARRNQTSPPNIELSTPTNN